MFVSFCFGRRSLSHVSRDDIACLTVTDSKRAAQSRVQYWGDCVSGLPNIGIRYGHYEGRSREKWLHCSSKDISFKHCDVCATNMMHSVYVYMKLVAVA